MKDPWSQVSPALRNALRRQAFAKDGGHCRIRGSHCKHGSGCPGCAEELDHIVPLAENGALLDPDNHRAACRPCNRRRDRPTKLSAAGASREW